jgi:hypothetical protein
MSCRTNIQDLKLNSGVNEDATPDQIVAEMWWKIESFRTAALAMVAAEMKVLIEKDMAERRKRGGTRRIPVRPAPLAF